MIISAGRGNTVLSSLIHTPKGFFLLCPQNLHLLAQGAPKSIAINTFRIRVSHRAVELLGTASLISDDYKERCDEGLFEVGEAETFRDFGDGCRELWGKVDGFVIR